MNYFHFFMVSMLMLPLSMFAGDGREPLIANESRKPACWTSCGKKLAALTLFAGAGTGGFFLHKYLTPAPQPPVPTPIPFPPVPEPGQGCTYITMAAFGYWSSGFYRFGPMCESYNKSSAVFASCPSYVDFRELKEDTDVCPEFWPHRCYSDKQVREIFPKWCASIPEEPNESKKMSNATVAPKQQLQQKLRAKIQRLENARRAR